MFDSGVTAAVLISGLKSEVDVAQPIPDASYVGWLCSLEQTLYGEVIREQARTEITGPPPDEIDLGDILPPAGADSLRFEDIYAVYADKTQLKKSTAASGPIFPDTYHKSGNALAYNTKTKPERMSIVFYVRPAIKTAAAGNVMLPYEFLDMARARLRGEAYKLCNEDALAAKWLADYNALLESFAQWLDGKRPNFGV